MTQDALAERAELAVRTIRGFETGRHTNPRADTVARLSDALALDAPARTELLAAALGQPAQPGLPESPLDQPAPDQAAPPPNRSAGGPDQLVPQPDHSSAGPDRGAARPDQRPASPDRSVAGPDEPGYRPGHPLASRSAARPDRLAEAADDLAHAVRARWLREEEQRRIQDPAPLPVRWQPVAEELTDHWANIRRVPLGDTSGPLDLVGQLDEIVPVYHRIPSGRLVVLGRAGSGKTILALRFVLDLLADPDRTLADPVPVIVSLSSWNPTATSLRDWLIGQLVRDHPGLAAPGPGGSTLAAALVSAGRIVPVLDGFDEIADGLHRPALEALNATTLPLVLTSRQDQYATAVAQTDVLTAAAAIELTDLSLADAGEYLRRTARRSAATGWAQVLAELERDPDGPASRSLTAVLATPLMVTLARTVYSDATDRDPAALLDTGRFSGQQALEDHLLDSFVPTVYGRPPGGPDAPDWEPERVRHWLGHLAGHLDRLGTRDLAWWELGSGARPRTRALISGLAAGLVLGLVDLIAEWLTAGWVPTEITFGEIVVYTVFNALLIGLMAGVLFGVVHAFVARRGVPALLPVRFEARLLHRRREVATRFLSRLGIGLAAGLAFGFGFGLLDTLLVGLVVPQRAGLAAILQVGLIDGISYAIVIGFGVGIVGGLLAGFEAPLDTARAVSPADLLTANRKAVLVQMLVWVPVLGLVIGFVPMLLIPLLEPLLGPLVWPARAAVTWAIVGGVGGGGAYLVSLTAWGQWLLFSRIVQPLRGRLPWAVFAFLDDAYRRGVLRQAGAVYQFRHARLQDRLTRPPMKS
jgi:transcriptional regulator with XRE-family HTH domain